MVGFGYAYENIPRSATTVGDWQAAGGFDANTLWYGNWNNSASGWSPAFDTGAYGTVYSLQRGVHLQLS